MRLRRKGPSPSANSTAGLAVMWTGLAILILAVGLLVGNLNDCIATEVHAHPYYSTAPGLDTDDLPAPVRDRIMAELNHRFCTCGCLMTLASCRNNHMSCRASKRAGEQIVDSAHVKIPPGHG